MNKAELIDAISAASKLSKADSKRALDAFIDVTTKA
ncbi:MAG: HU family DNA-binding protein, partial [Bacteroidota bacterium]